MIDAPVRLMHQSLLEMLEAQEAAYAQRTATIFCRDDGGRIEHAFLLAMGRKPSAAERERLSRFLSVQRDEFQSDPTAASLLVIKEQVFDSSPGGAMIAEESINPKQIPELAAWTALSRVLFNLDDFMTRE
jgi:hypothetical protein